MPAVESLMRLVTKQLPAPRYEKYEISGLNGLISAQHVPITLPRGMVDGEGIEASIRSEADLDDDDHRQ
jgi:hypothetical protein